MFIVSACCAGGGEDTARGHMPAADCAPSTPPESSHSSADENAAQPQRQAQAGKPKPEDSARTELSRAHTTHTRQISPRQRQAARPLLHSPAPLPPGYRPATAGAKLATVQRQGSPGNSMHCTHSWHLISQALGVLDGLHWMPAEASSMQECAWTDMSHRQGVAAATLPPAYLSPSCSSWASASPAAC